MTACYYPKTDTMFILQNYEGIFGTDRENGLTEKELEELNSLMNGQKIFFFDNWIAVYDAAH